MRIDILTIFPEMFCGIFDCGIVEKARQQGIVDIQIHDLRNYAQDRHRMVDDRPFGGGEGMVLKPEPIFEAVKAVRQQGSQSYVVLLSPQGTVFRQPVARRLADFGQLILICGRYEGVDQRVGDYLADEEISVGDFILTGGELAGMLIADAVTRLIPGSLGCDTSAERESFEVDSGGGLDCPHYTRPAEFRGLRVPEVLLSGDHGAIEQWRRAEAARRTRLRRPDLSD
ncbi:MAG: tRNA (guanosine(37)-N1)-methyltransferase TrmD [Acidobacteriota bacterium]